ncbi:MAG: 2-hydroxyacid dehydrogenase, partial [Mangrovicoccus sp.]
MSLQILFSAQPGIWDMWRAPLLAAFEREALEVTLAQDLPPETVDYILAAPNGPVTDFRPYKRCRAVMSLWAGVESFLPNETLTQPLTRMVDPGLAQGMVEWVTGHVLRHHLGLDAQVKASAPHWDQTVPPLAGERPVTVLGLGELGAACAKALAGLGFPVTGWARRRKELPGVQCLAGEDELAQALSRAQILVLLLPNTPATENVINAESLGMLPKGAVILNPGRGILIEETALLAALDRGQIAHATLDTFRIEPLPGKHPFWHHPQITVTPHIASATRPQTAAQT